MEHKRTTSDFIEAVGVWAVKNFEHRHGSHWGMMEEVGEAARAVLKRIQLISGYENEEFFRKRISDAFADTMIYLADFCYRRHSFFAFKRNQMLTTTNLPEEVIVTQVLQRLSGIFSWVTANEIIDGSDSKFQTDSQLQVLNNYCQGMCSIMEYWATYYKFDLEQISWEVWDRNVSKRDWKKDNQTGGQEH